MQERLKLIRKAMNKNQADFARLLGIGQSTLAMMEVSKRDISERHIKTICAICHVNETWLRTGVGEMFDEPNVTVIDQLSNQYDLDILDKKILQTYFDLPKSERGILRKFLVDFVAEVVSDDESYNEFKKVMAVAENSQVETQNNADVNNKIQELRTIMQGRDQEISNESTIQQELAAYRLELEAEKKAITLSVSDDSGNEQKKNA